MLPCLTPIFFSSPWTFLFIGKIWANLAEYFSVSLHRHLQNLFFCGIALIFHLTATFLIENQIIFKKKRLTRQVWVGQQVCQFVQFAEVQINNWFPRVRYLNSFCRWSLTDFSLRFVIEVQFSKLNIILDWLWFSTKVLFYPKNDFSSILFILRWYQSWLVLSHKTVISYPAFNHALGRPN